MLFLDGQPPGVGLKDSVLRLSLRVLVQLSRSQDKSHTLAGKEVGAREVARGGALHWVNCWLSATDPFGRAGPDTALLWATESPRPQSAQTNSRGDPVKRANPSFAQ